MATGFTYRPCVLKDHLGSWTTITDAEGNVEQELSFDAWGNLRDSETWYNHTQAEPVEAPMFDRDYTSHEHITAFGLINMNGRMYDPTMSSFLSVDAYVNDPTCAQSFNRYAYCAYNPLKYTDPTGWYSSYGNPNLAPSINPAGHTTYHCDDIAETLWGRSIHPCKSGNPDELTYTSSNYTEGNSTESGVESSESPDDDWVYDKRTGKYDWNDYANDEETTPDGYEYVGPDLYDVVLHDNEINGPSYDLLDPNYEESYGEISTPDFFTNFEMWLDSPSNNICEGAFKILSNMFYGSINSYSILFLGKTIGGTVSNITERENAFVDVAPAGILPAFTKTGQVINVTEKSLEGFNQFVKESKKAGVIFKGKGWQKEAGKAFQKNKVNQNSLKTFEKSRNVINHGNAIKNEYKKSKYMTKISI